MTSYEPQPEAMTSADYFENALVMEANGFSDLARKFEQLGRAMEAAENAWAKIEWPHGVQG